jgi:hypothetical protein
VKTSERRYRRWLWAYPKEYRDVRGEEILSTLLDASSRGVRYLPWDFLQIVAHGTHLRLQLAAKRFGRGTLPRSVRGAIACLLFVAVLNLLASVTAHNGPKNPGDHIGNVGVGVVLIGLCGLLNTWSRLVYAAVMGALVVLMSTNFVGSYAMSEVNVVVPLVVLVVPLVLLAIGWRRYAATAARSISAAPPTRQSQGL